MIFLNPKKVNEINELWTSHFLHSDAVIHLNYLIYWLVVLMHIRGNHITLLTTLQNDALTDDKWKIFSVSFLFRRNEMNILGIQIAYIKAFSKKCIASTLIIQIWFMKIEEEKCHKNYVESERCVKSLFIFAVWNFVKKTQSKQSLCVCFETSGFSLYYVVCVQFL